jgi:hypothetical protein
MPCVCALRVATFLSAYSRVLFHTHLAAREQLHNQPQGSEFGQDL